MLDKSLTTHIIRMQLSCYIQITWRVNSMDNFQTATGVQKQPESSSHASCPECPLLREGHGMLSYPLIHGNGEQPWDQDLTLYPFNLPECSRRCLRRQACAIPRDISHGFVAHAVITCWPFRYHSTCPHGEHLRLPLAPTAALGAAALYSGPPEHFHSSYKTPWALQQLLLTALTDPQRLRCPGQQHCSHDRKSSWFLT